MKKTMSIFAIALLVGLITKGAFGSYNDEDVSMEPQEEMQEEVMEVEQEPMAEPTSMIFKKGSKKEMQQEELSLKDEKTGIKRTIGFLKGKAKQLSRQIELFDKFLDKNKHLIKQVLAKKLETLKGRYQSLLDAVTALKEKKEAYLEKLNAQ